MNLKAEALNRGFTYLDTHSRAERVVTTFLAAIISSTDISRRFKDTYIESQKIHLRRGYGKGAKASLHLAAGVDEAMKNQERTFRRRRELVKGIVSHRRLNIKHSTEQILVNCF